MSGYRVRWVLGGLAAAVMVAGLWAALVAEPEQVPESLAPQGSAEKAGAFDEKNADKTMLSREDLAGVRLANPRLVPGSTPAAVPGSAPVPGSKPSPARPARLDRAERP